MTFNEANGEFMILHTFSQLQSNCKLFQQIITVFTIRQMQFNNSKHCTISAKIYCENI